MLPQEVNDYLFNTLNYTFLFLLFIALSYWLFDKFNLYGLWSNSYDDDTYKAKIKMHIHLVYLIIEYFSLLIITTSIFPPMYNWIVNSIELSLTMINTKICYTLFLVVVSAYTYEIIVHKTEINKWILLHHCCVIFIYYSFMLISIYTTITPLLSMYMLFTSNLLFLHVVLDIIPHTYLIYRKLYKHNFRTSKALCYICCTPLTILRILIDISIIGLNVHYIKVITMTYELILWCVIQNLIMLLLLVTQLQCHFMYVKLYNKELDKQHIKLDVEGGDSK